MPRDPRRKDHPIRLVRNAYSRSGFRHLSTAAGFSRMIGCSDSLVRNAEAGEFNLSDKLAFRIEDGTGVSAKWLKEASDRWKKGDDISKEPILTPEGKAWSPHDVNRYHFMDEFLRVIESFYRLSPELVPAFMGAVMESFLSVETSAPTNPLSHAGGERERKRITTSYILPVIKLIDDFGEDDQQRFFEALESCLGGRDAAVSRELLKIWEVMHTKDEYGVCFGRKARTEAPARSERGGVSGPQTKSVLRHFRAAKPKPGTPPDSVS